MARAIQYTHFINDKDNPDRAIVFRAYTCLTCGKLHETANNVSSFDSWIKAARSLIQVDGHELPPMVCEQK